MFAMQCIISLMRIRQFPALPYKCLSGHIRDGRYLADRDVLRNDDKAEDLDSCTAR
jgi:hypothetical protein